MMSASVFFDGALFYLSLEADFLASSFDLVPDVARCIRINRT